MSYSVELDIDSGTFDFFIDYSVPVYNDPETGEQFGDTSWTATVTPISGGGVGGGTGGYGPDSNNVIVGLGLNSLPGLVNYRLDFVAMNQFSGEQVTDSWNILVDSAAVDAVTISGTSGVDIVVAGHGNDLVQGLGGDDRLYGGDGNDTIEGGDGSDWIDGGRGADIMRGGLNADVCFVDDSGDVIEEAADGGGDVVYSTVSYTLGANVESLSLQGADEVVGTGNGGNNYMTANGGDTYLYGLGGNDVLVGNSGDDHLYGGDGDDRFEDLGGVDFFYGGVGNDTYKLVAYGDTLVERANEGTDTVEVYFLPTFTLGSNLENLVYLSFGPFRGYGNALNNEITGGTGADRLDGRGGDDKVMGGAGDDTIFGGAGSDILIGGTGWDTANYSASQAGIQVNLNVNFNIYNTATGGDAQGDALQGIEAIIGSAFDDSLTGTFAFAERLDGGAGNDFLDGLWGDDFIRGGAGADYMVGGLGIDTVLYDNSSAGVTVEIGGGVATGGDAQGDTLIGFENITGTSFDDHLIGDTQANVLRGGAGNDTLEGGGGDDTIIGGAGSDTMDGGAGTDLLAYDGTTTEVIVNLATLMVFNSDLSQDTISGFEWVRGGSGNDQLAGDDGANKLWGSAGEDRIDGGAGDDTIAGGAGADTLEGGEGLDRLSYRDSKTGVTAWLNGTGTWGDAAGDVTSGFENLEGGQAGDSLFGDGGANHIWGWAGFDYIDGMGGNDLLTGGTQADTFAFGYGGGKDFVLDFNQTEGDQLYLYLGEDFDTFEEVMAVASVSGASGQHVTFNFGANLSVTLFNTTIASLDAGDFLF